MMGLKKIFLSLLCSVLLAGWASAQDTTDTSQGSYFLSFVKKVYFNPTILLATQDFHEQHNVRVLVLPDLNGAEDNQITGFERGMQKIIRFLIEGDDEGSIRFYFDAEDTESPFSFVCSEELWCKFDKHKDSIEYYLNAPFQNTTFTINSHALFEASIEGALAYAEKCLQQNTSECSDKPEHQTLEINTKPLAISVHTTSGTHYDIDHKQHDLLESHYAKAHDVFTDQDWYAPAKFMVAGESPEPIAIAIDKHETLFKKQNLVFRTVYNNQVIPIEPSSTNDTIKLVLPDDLPSGNPVEVVVKYTSTVDSIQYTVGFFMVYVYEPKEVKLNILTANGYTLGTTEQTAIENQLKAVYDPVGVHFTVEKKEWMPDSEWSNNITIESSGLLSNYPPDLRDWVNGVQDLNDYDEDEYYLVFGLTTTELAGYMPRARNIGFVFAGATVPGKTAAHELGHGVYHLRHIFAEEELGLEAFKNTENVMDYADNPNDLHALYLHQWKFIDDPASVSWFGGDDEDAASRILNSGLIPNEFRNTDKTVSFLTPSLQIVRLPADVTHFSVSFGIGEEDSFPLFPSGVLMSFKAGNGSVYKCKIDNNGNFLGYFVNNELPFTWYVSPTPELKEKTQAVFNYYNILGSEYVMLQELTCGMYTGGSQKIADLLDPSKAAIKGLKYNNVRPLTTVYWSNVDQQLDDESPSGPHFRAYMKKMDNDAFGKQVLLMSKAIEYLSEYPYLVSYVTNTNNINEWKYKSRTSVNIAGFTSGLAAIFSATNPLATFLTSAPVGADGPESSYAGFFDLKVVNHNWDETKTQEELLSLFIKEFQNTVADYQEMYSGIINDLIIPNSAFIGLSGDIDKSTDYIVTSNPANGQLTYSKMQLRNAMNAMSLEQLAQIHPRMRTNLVALFLDGGETYEIMEREIVKLFETCKNGKDAVSFLMLLEKYERSNNKHILGEMLDKIDDETCFIGTDNFTELSRAFCELYNNMYNPDNYEAAFSSFYTEKIRPFVANYQKYSDVKKIKGAYITYNYSSAVWRLFKSTDYTNSLGSELISEVNFVESTGKIYFKNNIVNGFWILDHQNGRHFSPLEPIIFDDGGKVFSPYGYDAKNLHPYPALILYFAEKKAVSTSATDLIQLGVDVITFIIPGGAALRVIGLIDKTCAAASIMSSMTKYTHPEFSAGLSLVSGLMGLTTIGPNDISKLDDLGRNLKPSSYNAVMAEDAITSIAERVRPIDNYQGKVLETCENIDNAVALNPESKEFLTEFMKNEKRLAQVEGKFELVSRINQTITKLGGTMEASTGLVKMEDLLSAGIGITKEGDLYKLSGKTLGKMDNGKLKMNQNYFVSDFTKLEKDADLIGVLDDVEYKKGWMESSNASTNQGDVLIFKKEGNIFCLDGVNCFTANTPIATPTGTTSISDIRVDDQVITYLETDDRKTTRTVTNVFQRTVNKLQRLVIGKDTLFTTPEHPFYHQKQWLKAAALTVGMVLQSPFGADTVFANTTIEDTTASVYNFTVANSHTYVVGASQLLVHNDCERIGTLANQLPNASAKHAFVNSLRANKSLLQELINGSVKLEDWRLLYAAGRTDLLSDVAALKALKKVRLNAKLDDFALTENYLAGFLKDGWVAPPAAVSFSEALNKLDEVITALPKNKTTGWEQFFGSGGLNSTNQAVRRQAYQALDYLAENKNAIAGANAIEIKRIVNGADEVLELWVNGNRVVNGAENIIYKSDFATHLTDVVGFTQQRGVIGGHNLSNFENYLTSNAIDINRLSTTNGSIDGLVELSYQIKKADGSGGWKTTVFKKTIYDPAKISDAQVIQLGKEAMQEGITSSRTVLQSGSNTIIKGEASNGMKFLGYQDPATGEVLNFHPVISW